MPDLYSAFAAGAGAHPAATALEVDGDRLAYAELETLAGRLAARIAAATPAAPPRRIGLLASRTLAAYTGYLATLRLGATVVPLSPAWPAHRNAEVCRAAGVDTVIADRAGIRRLRAGDVPGLRIVDLSDAGWPARLDADAHVRTDADPAAFAYIIFTSGSTGRPKGVPITHANVHAFLSAGTAPYRLGPGARLSQTFELTFDPSVFDLFAAWSTGAAVVVPGRRELMSPGRFVAGRGITHWFSVPSLITLAEELGTLAPDSMPTLRHSLFAGEQLRLDQARAWHRAAPASTVENLYGPTELTVACTRYRLPADVREWPATSNGTVPIGRVYPRLESMLIQEGEAAENEGELCVRGPQRFHGYLHEPADPDPRRWYRTGDRVRVESGTLVHLGRCDDQLKVAGHRVEPAEIESALRALPGVRDAVAVLHRPPQNGELVALYTGTARPALDLIGELRHLLPLYMIPGRLIHLSAIPVTANGKTDRRRAAELVPDAD